MAQALHVNSILLQAIQPQGRDKGCKLTESHNHLSRYSIGQDDLDGLYPLGLLSLISVTLGFLERLQSLSWDVESLDVGVPSREVGSSGLLH